MIAAFRQGLRNLRRVGLWLGIVLLAFFIRIWLAWGLVAAVAVTAGIVVCILVLGTWILRGRADRVS
jgi:uncharacterized membrane protein (DUF485 family)